MLLWLEPNNLYNIFVAAVKSTTLIHVISSPVGRRVSAVTSLGDDVFVARFTDSQQVKVYDAVTLTLQRRLTVPELGAWPSGLAACPINNCLYASDFHNISVHRVELSGSNAVKKWSVACGPVGLSVNSKHNLIVACCEADKLQEYTTHGSLVREICLQAGVNRPWPVGDTGPWKAGVTEPRLEGETGLLQAGVTRPMTEIHTGPWKTGVTEPRLEGETGLLQAGVTRPMTEVHTGPWKAGVTGPRLERETRRSNARVTEMLCTELRSFQARVKPWHAIQLSTGDYVVSQRTSPGVVSVVGVNGQVVRSYGQSQTSDVGQMLGPASLAVTKNDDILVADTGNNRILSINSSLGSIQELALSVDGGIHEPRSLCLDESRGRLYIGEWGGECRVLVFDGVYV